MFAKTFRNSLLASSLLIGASLLVGPAAMANPATDGGAASGEIEVVNTIVFDPVVDAPITRGESVSFDLGTLDVTNNHANGWTLEVESTNGGVLRVGEDGATISYTNVTTGAMGASNATPRTLATAEQKYMLHDSDFDSAVAAGVTGVAVSATLTNTHQAPTGIYSDTLTFTLTSKDAP